MQNHYFGIIIWVKILEASIQYFLILFKLCIIILVWKRFLYNFKFIAIKTAVSNLSVYYKLTAFTTCWRQLCATLSFSYLEGRQLENTKNEIVSYRFQIEEQKCVKWYNSTAKFWPHKRISTIKFERIIKMINEITLLSWLFKYRHCKAVLTCMVRFSK